MRIGVPREIRAGERRVALVPESVRKLVKAGIAVAVERGAGERAFFTDAEFAEAGAALAADATALYAGADLVVKVQAPALNRDLGTHEAELMREGAMLLGTLVPARHPDVVEKLAARRITAFAVNLIPRITRAQAMDTLSSMANIAGYKAVVLAADHLPRYFPMLMTAAGTVFPAKVFVIGAGVAGLQAIATARRLGAAVEATDTRPAVKEQVESLGAKFVGAAVAEAQDASGYAKELSAEFYRKQAELIAERCAASDVVITTALIGGVKAPRLITAAMVAAMKPGSVIVDLAAEAGGNCELTVPGQTVVAHGVTICGPDNPPSDVPWHGSTLYSRNLTAFVLAFWKDGAFALDLEDEIIKGCLVTHAGEVRAGKAAPKPPAEGTTA
ncbi:MAG: Re/Si-specific NAD(P)(+) transhydrogenase subunit alpha [Thermoanaerobaculaceae bacterium]|nr:Re/Si-specific NAD(P)(+) transhydrogenase subunit alpha [Thermoanaerobaculaceae bacterium]